MAISVSEKKGREREGETERTKKGKAFRVDREITGFIIFSQLILSITNDRPTAGTVKELVFVLER